MGLKLHLSLCCVLNYGSAAAHGVCGLPSALQRLSRHRAVHGLQCGPREKLSWHSCHALTSNIMDQNEPLYKNTQSQAFYHDNKEQTEIYFSAKALCGKVPHHPVIHSSIRPTDLTETHKLQPHRRGASLLWGWSACRLCMVKQASPRAQERLLPNPPGYFRCANSSEKDHLKCL